MRAVEFEDLPMSGSEGILVDDGTTVAVLSWTVQLPPTRDLAALQLRLETRQELRPNLSVATVEVVESDGRTLSTSGVVYGPLTDALGAHVYRLVPSELPSIDA